MNPKQTLKYLIATTVLTVFFAVGNAHAFNPLKEYVAALDSPETNLIYPLSDTYDPTSTGGGIIDFEDPLNINHSTEYDPLTGTYIFSSTLGDSLNYRSPSSMTLEEYLQYMNEQSMQQYWNDRVDEQVSVNRNKGEDSPGLQFGGSRKGGIFGSDLVEIRPQGSAELKFGVNISRTDNPVLPEKQRRITTFDFDQKIQMNLTGKIGDLMKIGFNYNTEATFDFENELKLNYAGEEDDIIQKLEAGNVSMPLNSTLISGSQSLFGIKSELRFGRLTVTSVLSQQRGQKKEIEVAGGAQVNDFEIFADNYEENRHFFLNYYFREHYDQAMSTLPQVTSGIQIQRMEVWVTNRTNDYEDTRNIIGFTDLGEEDAANLEGAGITVTGSNLPDNNHNSLYGSVQNNSSVRNYVNASNVLTGTYGMVQSVEYEKLENARLLNSNEYSYNSILGFVSLNQSLNNDEVLAVAYQYTYQGETYQVGEFSTDGIAGQEALYVKLLKATVRNPKKKLWDLMMKNVYSLGAYQIDPQNFRLDIWYNNPSTSIDINYIPKTGIDNKLLTQVVGLDRLNQQQANYPDGVFDFIPISESNGRIVNGGTINPRNGRLYFTTVEPFGTTIDEEMEAKGISQAVRNTVVFQQLYDSTKTAAQQIPELNRFRIKGTYQSSVSSEISLSALNIPQGSVVVTAGGAPLQEGTDYTVDYNLGRVRILNEGILTSGTPIKISLESNSLFSIQTKSLLGTHLDYRISKNANIGATMMRLTEKPLTQKVNMGDEPIANTVLGLDGSFRREVPFLTKLVDKIPFINTKEKSMLNFNGEVATIIPGTNRAVNGLSYIDDFEGSQSAIDIRTFNSWVLASVPQGQPALFPQGALYNDLEYGHNRAKMAWYVIDPLFHNDNNLTPDHIKGHPMQENHMMRQVLVNEVFPNQQLSTGQLTNIPVLDLAYYPRERGPYNYQTDNLTPDSGYFSNPEENWAGIMRPLTTNDFEAANIEFIQFWVMDPFHNTTSNSMGEPASNEDSYNTTGGELYFHLGNVSEDILRDGRKAFENGLPVDGQFDPDNMETTEWGWVPTSQVIVNAFDNDITTREFQDVGFDGLGDDEEGTYFDSFLTTAAGVLAAGSHGINRLTEDPSSDNYHYFRGDDYDAAEATILERYKDYNNPHGNSPTSEMSAALNNDGYPTSASTLPNVEDINQDNNLNETESYFQYQVNMKPQNMNVGSNYITDRVLGTDNKSGKQVYWYQFRIPVREFTSKVNGIQDFRSIRFIRMCMKGWAEPVVLRFARLELIRGEWRSYLGSLLTDGEYLQPEESSTTFNISAVNIEQNGNREPINYVLPNGIQREINYQTANLAQQNEQSLVLDVCGLQDGDARAAYRNVNFDVLNYNKIEMYVHGESNDEVYPVGDDEVTVFVRLGSDFISNYYEYEMPVKISDWYNHSPDDVWPVDNNLVIDLNALKQVKIDRNGDNEASTLERYSVPDPTTRDDGTPNSDRMITVLGNPNLQNLKTIMIGVRNPKHDDPSNQWKPDDGLEKCVEVWVNELRLSDFNESGGWASVGRLSGNGADFFDFSVSGNYSTPYYGSIEQSVSERSQEWVSGVDASTTVQLGKFFGDQSGVRIPMYLGYSKNVIKPLFDPLSGDLDLTQNPGETVEEFRERLDAGRDLTQRRAINFTNVRIEKGMGKDGKSKKAHFWDISNFSLTYSYNEIFHRDINIEKDSTANHMAAINYGFNNNPRPWEPFKKVKFMRKSKWLRPIRDFNLYLAPKQLGFRSTMLRSYNEYRVRYNFENGPDPITQYNKNFNWDRDYNLKYDLSKSLKFDFTALNRAFVNEPFGKVDYGAFGYEAQTARDSINQSIASMGENMNYNHSFNITYKWPFSKFPLTDWISLTTRYNANYDWTRAPLALDQVTVYDNNGDSITSTTVGNVIQNSRVVSWNGKLNMTTLYNKVPYFKKVNKKYSGRGRGRKNFGASVGGNKGKGKGKGADNKEAEGDTTKNGKKKKPESERFNILEQASRLVMSLKNVSGTYNTNDGILLPGFQNTTEMLGMSAGFNSPSWQFVAGGFQETDIFGRPTNLNFARYAAQQDWLVDTNGLNIITSQYAVSHMEKLNLKATLKPITGLKIDLNADFNITQNTNSTLGWVDSLNSVDLLASQFTGMQSRSIITWRTAFVREQVDTEALFNKTFDDMRNSTEEVSNLFGQLNPITATLENDTNNYSPGYGMTQQDVIIGAFLTTYMGNPVNEKNVNPFSKMPLPNWRINYDGLSKVKFVREVLKIKVLSFKHAYRSNLNIANYTTNLNADVDNQTNLPVSVDLAGNLISPRQILTMSIMEQFAPLLGVDLTLENNLMATVEIKKDRNIALSLSNNQITEIKGSELVIGTGYTFKKLELPIKFNDKQIEPSDLILKCDVSIRDNKTITRKIVENQNQATAGQKMISINFSGSYSLGKGLSVRAYFDRIVNKPFISTSFPTANTNAGFAIRFMLQ